MESAGRSQPARRGGPLRLLLIGLVGILVVGTGVELHARRQADRVYGLLQDLLDTTPGLEPDVVHQRLGVAPAEAHRTEDKRWIETYRWGGLLRVYSVEATYRIGATKLLTSIKQGTAG